jgi:phage-related protein
MIRQSLYFTYAGIRSDDMGVVNVNISSGMQSEPFAASISIREVVIKGNSRPYFQGIQQSPLEFTVTFAFNSTFTSDDLRAVSRWLYEPNFYSPLQFFDGTGEDLNQIYYALFVGEPEIVHNSANAGYINLKVRCNDAYAYSGIYTSEIYDYTTNSVGGTSYVFENLGDVETQPLVIVEIVSGSTFTITNTSDSGKVLSFTGLGVSEVVTIDCENEIIASSLGLDRYDNMTTSSDFFKIPRGFNYMNIKGNVKIQWKYENKYRTG